MSNKMIESFLDYESKRSSLINGNEFQLVKQLEERNNARRGAGVSANSEQIDARAGSGYSGGPQANTPVSTTTLSDFPSIENATKIFGKAGLNPVGSIASGIGAAARSVADGLFSSDEPRRQFPTPEAMRPTPAPAADQAGSADSKQIIPASWNPWGWKNLLKNPEPFSDRDAFQRWQFRGYSDPSPKGFERATPASPNDGKPVDAPEVPAPTLSQRIADRANREAATQDITNGSNQPNPATERPKSSVARAEDEAGAPPKPELASVGTRTTNFRVGSRGDDVKSAQKALGISDDGIYGNQTRQAVMDFQRKHGLQVDGIIGDQTMSALRRARVGLSVRGSGAATNESVEFSEAELAHFKSILEAMPVAPTAEGHGPNPTPKNKAEGGKGRGSLSEKMDPVGEEDDDVNNDGEVKPDDEYLRRRRNAIADNMKKKK